MAKFIFGTRTWFLIALVSLALVIISWLIQAVVGSPTNPGFYSGCNLKHGVRVPPIIGPIAPGQPQLGVTSSDNTSIISIVAGRAIKLKA
jgi:hypothetical protein